jgi:hypothetical protein
MAELYIIDGFDDPIDISYYTEEEKEEFFKLRPNAKKAQEETQEIEEVKETGSAIKSVDALPEINITPEGNMDLPLEISSLDSRKSNVASDEEYKYYVQSTRITKEERDLYKEEINQINLKPYSERIGRIKGSSRTVIPYQKEKNLAKQMLNKEGIDLTPENVNNKTREILLVNKENDAFNNKVKKYLKDNDISEEEQLEIGFSSTKEKETLSKDVKNFEFVTNKFKEGNFKEQIEYNELIKSLKDPNFEFDVTESIKNNEELFTLKDGRKIPASIINKLDDLAFNVKIRAKYLNEEANKLALRSKNEYYLDKDIDLLSRDYSVTAKAWENATNSITEAALSGLVFGADVIDMTGEFVSKTPANKAIISNQGALGKIAAEALEQKGEYKTPEIITDIKEAINLYRKKSNKEFQDKYAYAPSFDNGEVFSSLDNFVEFAVVNLAGQTGTMAQLLTPGGLYILGATSYGRTISDIEIADEQAGSETGNFEKRLTALGYASSEVILGAMPTMKLLGGALRGSGNAARDVVNKNMFDYFKNNWKVIPESFATEYVSEGATQMTQNMIDIIRGEKSNNQLMEGVGEAAFTGGLLGPMITSAPFMKGMVLANYSDWQKFSKFRKNATGIEILNNEMFGMDKRTKEYKTRLDLVNELTKANSDILNNLENDVLNNLDSEGASLYQETTTRQEQIRQEAQTLLDDTDLDPDVKANRLKKLKADFDIYESKRNLFKQDFTNIFNIETEEVRTTYLKKASNELGLIQGVDSDKTINKKAIELYSIDKLKEANERGINAINLLGKAGVNVSYNYETNNSELLLNYKEQLDALVENKTLSENDAKDMYKEAVKDIKSGELNGINLNYTDKNGKKAYNIYVSQENALKNGRTQTSIHEIGHTIFIEGLSSDPEAYNVLAQSVIKYLAENNESAYRRVIARSANQSADEVLTNFLEEVSSGRLELEANRSSKDWTSIFGFNLSNILNTQSKTKKAVEFKNTDDIVTFLQTLGTRIKDGTLTVGDIKKIKVKGLPSVAKTIDKKTTNVKKSKIVNVSEMSKAFDDIVVGKNLKSNEDFKTSDQGQNLIDAFDVVSTNEKYNSYVNSLITRDSSLGSLPSNIRQDINRQIKEGVQDRITKNYNPMFGGSFQSLFSFVYGDAKGQGGRTQSALLDVKKQYIKQPKTIPLVTSEGTSIDIIDSSKGADEMFDDKLKTRKRNVSKLGRGLTLRGKKLVTIENNNGITLQDEIETAALETFESSLPDVDSKEYQKFVLNQENPIRKAIQQRAKSTADFKQLLKEFNGPLYKSYPLSVLVQMDKNNEVKTLIKEIKKNISPTEVDKAIAENKLPKNTSRTSGPTLYEHGSPTVAQLNNFFFGDNVGPSTKGTRKDAFFRGLAQKLIYDMAPSAARKAGRESLEITKMSSKLNVDPSARFSRDSRLTLNQFIELDAISQLKDKDALGRNLKFSTPTINEDSRPSLIKNLLKNAKFLSDVTINGAAMASGGRKPFYGNSKNKYSSKKVAINNGIKEPIKYFKTTTGEYIKSSAKLTRNDWVPKVGKLFYAVTDPNYIEAISLAKQYKGKKPVRILIPKNGRITKEFLKSKDPQIKANMAALEYMINELNDAYKKGMPLDVAGTIVIQSYQATGGLIKIAAPFKYVSDTFEYGDKKDGELKYREEHNPPASVVGASIMWAIKNNKTPEVITAIKENYYQTQLSKKDDSKLDRAKLDSKLFKGTNIFDNPITRLAAAGIDLNTLKNPLTGKTIAQEYNAGISQKLYNSFSETGKAIISAYQNVEIIKSITDSNNNISENLKIYAKLVPDMSVTVKKSKSEFSPKLDGTNTTSEQIEILGNYDKAASLARSFSTPTKKIRVFDFDDTLAKTKSKVIVNTLDGKTIKINATQFAQQAQTLEADGAIFDFTEFEKIIDGKKGPLFDLAKTMSEAEGKRDIFVLTARPQASATAIKEFLDGIGLNIPLTNITGLENGSPSAKANWIIEKAANGYNDFYFADDAYKNVKAVKEILDQIDVKSKVQLAKFSKQADMDKVFNDMIERSTGIESFKQYSDSKARRIGKNKGKYNFFIPPSAEDFAGLMYKLYGKGKQGDADMKWIKKNILDPFNRAENALTQARLSVANDYRALKKNFKTVPKTLKKEAFDGFTYSDALRVSIWTSQGMDIPGLSKSDIKELNDFVNDNTDLKVFAQELLKIQKGKEYPAPTDSWLGGTITTDIIGGINKVNRAEYLQEWQENIDVLFSDKNKNKLRAAFGDGYVEALEDIIRRMKSGSNRARSSNKIVNNITDWINNSVGAIMFFNARSAVLQTISSVNFINLSDNNILKAGLAFANQPQYWKDFMFLMNSDYLTTRRNGLKINVSESEIADAVKESQNKPKAAIAYILSKGFLPTQFADSFAIASGGATYYRNRIKKLMKDGMPQDLAEQQAFLDFYDIAEETQQSSRTDRISMQQASTAGRVILAFANTPMQYARIQKKALLDLKNGRGDAKTHISKLIYYGFVQNLIFNAMQNALFAIIFDDEENNKIPKEKTVRIANGMADSLLRGIGIAGAATATVKNIIFKLYEESEKKSPKYEDAALELLSFSPPIDSKVSKFRSALRTFSWNSEEIKEKGFSLDNPAYMAGGQVISAFTNVPLDRVVRKYDNLAAAFKKDTETWQSLALIAGWSKWEVGIKNKRFKKKSKTKTKKRTFGKNTL